MKIRDEIDKHLKKEYWGNKNCFDYLEVDEVYKILDDIESDVIDVYNILRNIEGLSEIDEAKKLLENLSLKLY